MSYKGSSSQKSVSCYVEGNGATSCYSHGYTPGSPLTAGIKNADYLKNKNNPLYQKEVNDPFKSMAKDYLAGEGKNLESYLSSIGKSANVKEYGTADLGDNKTIASLLTYSNNGKKESVMLGNNYGMGFQSRLERMATRYGLAPKETFEYVMAHETMHAAGFNSEMEAERATRDFFNYMNSKSNKDAKRTARYQRLANAAGTRIQELGLLGLEKYVARYYTHGKNHKKYGERFRN